MFGRTRPERLWRGKIASISLTAEELQGRQLLDETGRGIGEITDLYVDDDGRPHWLLVDTGFFPGFFSVIPVTDVLVTDKGLEVHYDMEKLTGAPNNMGVPAAIPVQSSRSRNGFLLAVHQRRDRLLTRCGDGF